MCRNHLGAHSHRDPRADAQHFSFRGRAQEPAFLTHSQEMLTVWGPHLEKAWHGGCLAGSLAHREVLKDSSCHCSIVFATVSSAVPTCMTLGRVPSILAKSVQKLPPREPLPHSAQEAVESWGSGGPGGLTAWVGTWALPVASRTQDKLIHLWDAQRSPSIKWRHEGAFGYEAP